MDIQLSDSVFNDSAISSAAILLTESADIITVKPDGGKHESALMPMDSAFSDLAPSSSSGEYTVPYVASDFSSSSSSSDELIIGLYNANSDTLISIIEEGDQILESDLGKGKVTIAAFVSEDSALSEQIGSISLNLNDGQKTRVENVAPYALFGDKNGDFKGGTLQTGENNITLDIYSQKRLKGEFIGTVSRNFEVVSRLEEAPTQPNPAPDSGKTDSIGSNQSDPGSDQSQMPATVDIPPPVPTETVTVNDGATQADSSGENVLNGISVGLYDANSDRLIQEIKDGDTILASDLSQGNVTLAALLPEDNAFSGQVKSVFLDLNDGQVTRTENVKPYALFGDTKGDFHGGSLPSGENSITLDIYSQSKRQGEHLGTISREFTIVDNLEDAPSPSSGGQPSTDLTPDDTPTPAPAPAPVPAPAPAPKSSGDKQWTSFGEPGTGGRIDSIAVSPYDSDVVLVGGDILSAYRSTNQGSEWSTTSGWMSYEIADFTWHPTQKNTVWAGSLSGPHLSTDGGKTWTAQRDGLPEIESSRYSAPVEKILFDPNSNDLLAFGGDHRQLRSPGTVSNYGVVWSRDEDGGDWSKRSTIVKNGNIMDVSYAGNSNQKIYSVVWEHGFYHSSDDGKSWQAGNKGLPRDKNGKILATSVAVHPDDSGTAWVTIQDAGIYKTTNGGENWSAVNDGIPSGKSQFWSIEVADDGETLYAGNRYFKNGGGVYKSTDAGENWTRVFSNSDQIEGGQKPYPGGINPWWVEVDPQDSDTVYIGTDNAVYRSSNGGETWSPMTAKQTGDSWVGTGFSGLVARNVEWNPYNEDHVVVQGMDAAKAIQSRDGGKTWQIDNPGLPLYDGGHDVAFTPDWMFSVFGQGNNDNELIARSQDEGQNWTVIQAPVSSSEAKHVHADTTNPDRLWIVVDDQLWYTDEATSTTKPEWTRLKVGPKSNEIGDLEADPRDQDTFYVGTDEGIYRTTNGSTFEFIGGPKDANNLDLHVAPSDPDIVYATANKSFWGDYGVWRYDAGKESWQRLWEDNRDVSSTIGDIAVHPNNADYLAIVTNDNPYHDQTEATGVWTSQNGGKTWKQQTTEGLPMLRGNTIAFDPSGENIVVGLGGAGFYTIKFDS